MTSKVVQLPESVQPFSEKTMLMCLDHKSALVYAGEENTVAEEEAIVTDANDYEYSDKEGFHSQGGVGFTTGTDSHVKEHSNRIFLNHLAKELHSRFQRGRFQRLAVFLPDDMKNMVKEKIPREILDRTQFVSGNLKKSSPIDLVKRMKS